MKNTDRLYWVGTMNAIKQQAEGIIFKELIYMWNFKNLMKNLEINVIIKPIIEIRQQQLHNLRRYYMSENETIKEQIINAEEKAEAISHKDNSLKRLDVSFNKHIELLEYKKTHLLAYWIENFSQYHDEERLFDSSTLKVFKRGDIVKVNLGFNVGNEMRWSTLLCCY